jgi:hypothetical protein
MIGITQNWTGKDVPAAANFRRNLKCQFGKGKIKFRNPGTKFRFLKTKFGFPKTGFRNLGSRFGNPGARFGDRKTVLGNRNGVFRFRNTLGRYFSNSIYVARSGATFVALILNRPVSTRPGRLVAATLLQPPLPGVVAFFGTAANRPSATAGPSPPESQPLGRVARPVYEYSPCRK